MRPQKAHAVLEGPRGRAPAWRTADHEQDTENTPPPPKEITKSTSRHSKPSQNYPISKSHVGSAEGEARPHAEKPAQERVPAPADLHHLLSNPSFWSSTWVGVNQIFMKRIGGQRVWVPAHPSPEVNTQLKSRKNKKKRNKQNKKPQNKNKSANFQCINSTQPSLGWSLHWE